MFLGQTDTTRPAELSGSDKLQGFSGGGYSTAGDIFDAVYDDAKMNNSMFGLQQNFQDLYETNADRVFELTGEQIPAFNTIRYKDFARSLYAEENLGEVDLGDYVVDLDAINAGLSKMKEAHPEIQTFEDLYTTIIKKARATEDRAMDVLNRTSLTGDVVGFISGMAGAFNTNDPLNVVATPLGGWGKQVVTRLLNEAGIGGVTEAINQFLGVSENRKLMGLDNSTWRAAQQILFAAGGAAVFRGVAVEGAPAVYRAAERKIAPERAMGREMLKALEDVGVPVRSEEFLFGVATELAPKRAGARAGMEILGQERDFARANALGDTPEGRAAHHEKAAAATEEYRAGLEDEMNGVEPPRTSIFEDIPLRGVEEMRGVEVARVNEILDEASKDIDAEIKTKTERIAELEKDIAAITEKLESFETRPFSELLREVSVEKADALAAIEAEKAKPNLGKTRRGKLAKAEEKIRQSPEGEKAAENRATDVHYGNKERGIQQAKVQVKQKEIRALELRRKHVRGKAHKAIDATPKKILTPAADRVKAEGIKLVDADPPHIAGIPDRGGLSPSEHVNTTVTRLEEADPTLEKRADEDVARVERSFDEADGTYDIGAKARVSGDLMVSLDDGTSMSLRDHLADIRENERVVAAMRSCVI